MLNPGGVRIGTAEIYRQVEQVPEVLESLVIGQDWQNDVRVVLFVRLREGVTLDEALIARINRQIRDHASPRHVPARIVQVADIPRTKSGKIVELAVRDVVHGRPVKNREALANPEALEFFRDRPELRAKTLDPRFRGGDVGEIYVSLSIAKASLMSRCDRPPASWVESVISTLL